MFVRKSTYDALVMKHDALQVHYTMLDKKNDKLIDDWNKLVRWVKKLGGVEAIETAIENQSSGVFSQDEIESLIRLCHPDKHGGSGASNRLTTKLLQLRNKR